MPGTRPGMTKLKGCRRRAAIESIARHQKSNPVRPADLRKATGILLSDFSEKRFGETSKSMSQFGH
jgi:hypothetical protein